MVGSVAIRSGLKSWLLEAEKVGSADSVGADPLAAERGVSPVGKGDSMNGGGADVTGSTITGRCNSDAPPVSLSPVLPGSPANPLAGFELSSFAHPADSMARSQRRQQAHYSPVPVNADPWQLSAPREFPAGRG